jgi:hypothetical protein
VNTYVQTFSVSARAYRALELAVNFEIPPTPELLAQLCENIFHNQLVLCTLCNPTHKTETGTANRWGTNNYHGPITNTEQQLDHICYTLLATATGAILMSQNNFPEPNRHMVNLLHRLTFTVQDHTTSTTGDGLILVMQMILLNATIFDKMYYKGLANDIEGKFKYNVLQKNFKPWMQCSY